MMLRAVGRVLLLVAALVAVSCGESAPDSRSDPSPRTTRQEVRSTNKVLILGSSVNGGINSREADAVRAASSTTQIDVVTPAQWSALTATQFMAYKAIIIGDAACQSGTAAFQAAIDNRNTWGAIVDGDVALLATDPTTNGTDLLVENGVRFVLNSVQYTTGMYVSLGCAYRSAPGNTPVPLLEPFGSFRVQGLSPCADSGHMFEMYNNLLSDGLWDGLLGGAGGCAARSVFTQYPERTFSFAALAMNSSGAPVPGETTYTDYTYDPGNETVVAGTPYILLRGAMTLGAGCGLPYGQEECDLGDGINGSPAGDGQPPESTCSWTCHRQWCGDGHVDTEFGEECDNGIHNGRSQDSSASIGACTSFCKIPQISEKHPPTALCKNVTVVATNTCGMAADINNGSFDPDNDLVGCTQGPAGPYAIGNTLVTLTCTDQANNSATCTGTVTVTDKVPPTVTLTAPVNQSVECTKGGTYTDPGSSASDPCEGLLPPSSITRTGTVSVGVPSTYTLSYQATDSAGNTSAIATRSVTVADTLAPTLTRIGGDVTRECGSNFVEPGITANDQCDGMLTNKIVRTGTVNTAVVGTYVLRYNVKDAANHPAEEVLRNVTIRDTTAPTVTLNTPSPQTAECGTAYVDPGATVTDTCASSLTAVVNTSNINMGAKGIYTINYKATDPSGNTGYSSNRTVTVNDTLGPTVTLVAPVNQPVECTKGGTYADPGSSATDLCEGALPQSNITRTGTVSVGVPSTYSLSYQAADSLGNTSAIVTRSVTVADTLAPILTLTGGDVTRECGSSFVEPGMSANDQCDGVLTSKVIRTGTVNTAALGSYVLRYNVKDAANHPAAEATRTVNIRDTTAPTVTLNTPSPQTAECGGTYADPGATATDTCAGPLTAVVNASSISMGTPGSYNINYKATDPSGNTGYSSNRAVTVSDTLAPTLTLNGQATLAQECAAAFNDPGATAIDQCYGNLTSQIVKTGTVNTATLGSYTVRYNVKDPNNLAAPEVTRTVTVRDTLPPVITMNGPPTQTLECGSTYTDPGATAADACAGPVTVVLSTSANPNAPGSYLITYTATDPSGNKVTLYGARTVTVNDTLPPTLTLLGSASQALECGTPYNDPGAKANDACYGDITNRIARTGSVNPGSPGSYNLVYTVSDPSGRSSPPLARTVNVSDTLPPTLTVLGSANLQHECGTPYTDAGATATDLCAGTLPITTTGSVNSAVIGNYSLAYSAADPTGHRVSGGRAVAVRDTLPPQIQLNPGPSVLPCNGAPYVDPGATATDLCAGNLTSRIVTSSNLDQTRAGQYAITYSVSDNTGHTATATRPITVQGAAIHLNDFNLFLLEDYSGGHDVQGKIAVGGNLSMTNFTVGAGQPASDIANTLVAGGNLTLSHGGVWGDTWYGGTYTPDSDVVIHRGTLAKGTPINFATRFSELRTLTSQLANMVINGTTTKESWGGVVLKGTSPTVNVFEVNATAFSGATNLSITAPANSLAVVNIRGTSASLSSFSITLNGGLDQSTVLYNFPEATTINAQGIGFRGTVLAPYARLTFNNGSWDGGIYAVSMTGSAEGHINPLPDQGFCQ
ncbi:immunoglobulin-like domain-containing protein [Hyalangium versicolor]|uniref:immunoglobulin-like domain-containing protein n=1 Tax=Hyalangium versicolor TaxID=2861190 RepID=UPI001CCF90F8|nr:immunoglobulin-like domain-containing protein [Hyalangium versicolor]